MKSILTLTADQARELSTRSSNILEEELESIFILIKKAAESGLLDNRSLTHIPYDNLANLDEVHEIEDRLTDLGYNVHVDEDTWELRINW